MPESLTLEEASEKFSPINLVGPNSPQVLTIHGTKDDWVPYDQDKYLGITFFDTLSFIKQEGEWKIYNKLFNVESE